MCLLLKLCRLVLIAIDKLYFNKKKYCMSLMPSCQNYRLEYLFFFFYFFENWDHICPSWVFPKPPQIFFQHILHSSLKMISDFICKCFQYSGTHPGEATQAHSEHLGHWISTRAAHQNHPNQTHSLKATRAWVPSQANWISISGEGGSRGHCFFKHPRGILVCQQR